MNKLDMLYEIAAEIDVHIHDFKISEDKKALCIEHDGYKAIAIDDKAIKSHAEEKELLAHELGCYETGGLRPLTAFQNEFHYRNSKLYYAAKANQWSYDTLLSPEDIQTAIDKGHFYVYDIAEYCNNTFEFVDKAMKYHKSCGIAFDYPEEYYLN